MRPRPRGCAQNRRKAEALNVSTQHKRDVKRRHEPPSQVRHDKRNATIQTPKHGQLPLIWYVSQEITKESGPGEGVKPTPDTHGSGKRGASSQGERTALARVLLHPGGWKPPDSAAAYSQGILSRALCARKRATLAAIRAFSPHTKCVVSVASPRV